MARVKETERPATLPARLSKPEPQSPGEGKPAAVEVTRRVLIVDDSSTQLAFAEGALRQAGLDVRVSDNVWIASCCGDFRPDVVLVDVNLAGGCSGPSLIKAFKKRSLGKSTRFVLYSSAPIPELERLAEDCGADGCIQKHADGVRLAREVVRLLEKKA